MRLKETLKNPENLENKSKPLIAPDIVGQFVEEDLYPTLPEGAPRPPFRAMISGYSGSGKTNLMLDFVINKYVDGDDSIFTGGIYVMSPSIFTDKAYRAFAVIKKDWIEEDVLKMYKDIDVTIIKDIVENHQDKSPKLVIIDDSAANPLLNKPIFIDCFLHSRQNNVSWFIMTQGFRKIPKILRNSMSDLYIFGTNNDHEIVLLEDELASRECFGNDLIGKFKNLEKYHYVHKNCLTNTFEVI